MLALSLLAAAVHRKCPSPIPACSSWTQPPACLLPVPGPMHWSHGHGGQRGFYGDPAVAATGSGIQWHGRADEPGTSAGLHAGPDVHVPAGFQRPARGLAAAGERRLLPDPARPPGRAFRPGPGRDAAVDTGGARVRLPRSVRLPRDYYVRVFSNDYSVDPGVIGRIVDVVPGLEKVTVRADGQLLASARAAVGQAPDLHRPRACGQGRLPPTDPPQRQGRTVHGRGGTGPVDL